MMFYASLGVKLHSPGRWTCGMLRPDCQYYICHCPHHFHPLGSSHYIVWLTSSDKGVLCLVEGKKIKIKIYILTLVGGKNKKKVGKLLFILKINKFNWNLCSFGEKIL